MSTRAPVDWLALLCNPALADLVVHRVLFHLEASDLGRMAQLNTYFLKLVDRDESDYASVMERLWAQKLLFGDCFDDVNGYPDQYQRCLHVSPPGAIPALPACLAPGCATALSDRSLLKRVWHRLPADACSRITCSPQIQIEWRPMPAGPVFEMYRELGVGGSYVLPGTCTTSVVHPAAAGENFYGVQHGLQHFVAPPPAPSEMRFGWDDIVYHCDVFVNGQLVLATRALEPTGALDPVGGGLWLTVSVEEHMWYQARSEHNKLRLGRESRPWCEESSDPWCQRVRTVLMARRRGGTGHGVILSDLTFGDYQSVEGMGGGKWSACSHVVSLFPLDSEPEFIVEMCNYHDYAIDPVKLRYESDDDFFGTAHPNAKCKVHLDKLQFLLESKKVGHVDQDEAPEAEHHANWLRLLHHFL
jgi:hypothetical protein